MQQFENWVKQAKWNHPYGYVAVHYSSWCLSPLLRKNSSYYCFFLFNYLTRSVFTFIRENEKLNCWAGQGTAITHLLLPPQERRLPRALGNAHRLSNSCPQRAFPVKACGYSNEIPAWPDKATHRQAHADRKTGAWAQCKRLMLGLRLWAMGFGLPWDLQRNFLPLLCPHSICLERPVPA